MLELNSDLCVAASGLVLLMTHIRSAVASPQGYTTGGRLQTCHEPQYVTTWKGNVTANYGNQGWVNWSGDTCRTGVQEEGCELTASSEKGKEIAVEFGGGAEFDIAKALTGRLDFGVTVATSETKGNLVTQHCVKPTSGECVCGVDYAIERFRAEGYIEPNACNFGDARKPFNITSPTLVEDSPKMIFQLCKTVDSTCPEMDTFPLCNAPL